MTGSERLKMKRRKGTSGLCNIELAWIKPQGLAVACNDQFHYQAFGSAVTVKSKNMRSASCTLYSKIPHVNSTSRFSMLLQAGAMIPSTINNVEIHHMVRVFIST